MYTKFEFRGVDKMSIAYEVEDELEMSNRGNNVPSSRRVCFALRNGNIFTCVCAAIWSEFPKRNVTSWGEWPNATTTCSTMDRLSRLARGREKGKFCASGGFSECCWIHRRDAYPHSGGENNEHQYVNGKYFHSLNVQVILCNQYSCLFYSHMTKPFEVP